MQFPFDFTPVLMLKAFGSVFGQQYGTSEAPWLLALHGWARSHSDFDGVLAAQKHEASQRLGQRGRDLISSASATLDSATLDSAALDSAALDAVALDLAGFGATPAPPTAWGSDDYAKSVEHVVESMAQARQGRVVLMGHSFGGRVSIRLAVLRPDLVQALILTGVPLLAKQGQKQRQAWKYKVVRRANKVGFISDSTMDQWRYRYGSYDYKMAQGTVRTSFVKIVNENYESNLKALDCPVELIWGAGDAVVPVEVAERATRLVTNSSLTVRPGVGHMLVLEDPESLRDAARRCKP